MDSRQEVVLGHVSGAFGVQGWVKVFSETEPRENIVNYREWRLTAPAFVNGGHRRTVRVEQGRKHGKSVIAKLDGVSNRNDAEALRGYLIAVGRGQLPELDKDEFYWADLVGLAVVDQHDKKLGTVDRLMETGANDVLVVSSGTDNEILIPWVRDQVIVAVDLGQGLIRVDWDPAF